MKDLTRNPPTDPFATLVTLTAAALTGAARPEADPQPPQTPKRWSLLDRLDRWLWTARQQDLERALTTAVDARDVEARLNARERLLLQRYY